MATQVVLLSKENKRCLPIGSHTSSQYSTVTTVWNIFIGIKKLIILVSMATSVQVKNKFHSNFKLVHCVLHIQISMPPHIQL